MTASVAEIQSQVRAARIAWVVLVVAFAISVVVCAFGGTGVQFFLFESTVPINAELTIGRGTAGLTGTDLIETVVRGQRTLTNSSIVSTDALSQATIQFADPRLPDEVVAFVTVNSGTVLDMTMLSRPRFDWSSRGYEISLTEISGSVDVWIPTGLPRPISIELVSAAGDRVVLAGGGRYQAQMSAQQVRVINDAGSAVIVAGESGEVLAIGEGQRGLFYPADGQFLLLPGFSDLLNGQQMLQAVQAEATPEPDAGVGNWSCYNGPYDDPVGVFESLQVRGRTTVHLQRGQGAQSHGETGCVLTFGAAGQDVHEYDYLSVEAVFRIDNHSLSLCGIEGSECPLMLRIDYVPVSGQSAQSWYQGFYSMLDPRYTYRTSCASCRREHDAVNMGAWYTFRSDNLRSLLPPDLQPGSVLNVRFYASGHEYDVQVAEMSLLAGEADPPPPASATDATGG
jgi:hypothetical protein